MDEGWEIFIAKGEKRCPRGFHRDSDENSQTFGQCVDADGNVYQGEVPEDEGDIPEDNESEQSEESQSEDVPEEPSDKGEPDAKGEPNKKKTVIQHIKEAKERSKVLTDTIMKHIPSLKTLQTGRKSTVVFFATVGLPLRAIASAYDKLTKNYATMVKARSDRKKLKDAKATFKGYNKALQDVADVFNVRAKDLKDRKWSEEDVRVLKETVNGRIEELMGSDAIKRLKADKDAGKNPLETGSIYSEEYGELKALTLLLRSADERLQDYYTQCQKRGIEIDEKVKVMLRMARAKERREKRMADGKRVYDEKTGDYRLVPRDRRDRDGPH